MTSRPSSISEGLKLGFERKSLQRRRRKERLEKDREISPAPPHGFVEPHDVPWLEGLEGQWVLGALLSIVR